MRITMQGFITMFLVIVVSLFVINRVAALRSLVFSAPTNTV